MEASRWKHPAPLAPSLTLDITEPQLKRDREQQQRKFVSGVIDPCVSYQYRTKNQQASVCARDFALLTSTPAHRQIAYTTP